jgi:pyrimidine and pyridine-specific 5'-nucleotidase
MFSRTTHQHAERVLKVLNLRDLMEDVIYCDYASEHFTCKPEPEYYQQVQPHP